MKTFVRLYQYVIYYYAKRNKSIVGATWQFRSVLNNYNICSTLAISLLVQGEIKREFKDTVFTKPILKKNCYFTFNKKEKYNVTKKGNDIVILPSYIWNPLGLPECNIIKRAHKKRISASVIIFTGSLIDIFSSLSINMDNLL